MQKAVRCLKRAAFFVDRSDAQYVPAEYAADFGLAQSQISFLLRPASYSPRCSPMRWIRHWRRTWGNLTKYNVGRWLKNDLEEGPDGMHKEKAPDIV